VTQALDGAFDGGLLHIDALQGRPGGKFTIERFVQIYDHHDSGLERDSEQRDVANPVQRIPSRSRCLSPAY